MWLLILRGTSETESIKIAWCLTEPDTTALLVRAREHKAYGQKFGNRGEMSRKNWEEAPEFTPMAIEQNIRALADGDWLS